MKKLKISMSRINLVLLSLLILLLAKIIETSIRYQTLSTYNSLIDKVSYGFFLISLIILFFEKKLLALFVFIVSFILMAILIRYNPSEMLLHYSFYFYKNNHPDFFSKCIKEEYHNSEKQILAYCFTVSNESNHSDDGDILYDSGNELNKPYTERSCDWWRAFSNLAMKSRPSRLNNFTLLETVKDMNLIIISLGYSYYEVRYSFEPFYIDGTQKNTCK
ncbi:hypothetical protein [Dickeya zeae]|uniref:hypothetical protein n=1 Tax=Dickeya zeae TaxID=204042 RepID=UPI00143FF36E|nr:hypothetical protein [Dickeya zeae]QIZ46187.1 hypothetical protein DWV07_04430 [Dickeya zeae]